MRTAWPILFPRLYTTPEVGLYRRQDHGPEHGRSNRQIGRKEQLDGMNLSAVLYDEVTELLEEDARQADANDRKTVQLRDL